MAFMANSNKEAFPVSYYAVLEIFCIFCVEFIQGI